MGPLRRKLYGIVFGTSTKAGKIFDIWLLAFILASVLVVMLESVPDLGANHMNLFLILEWGFTIIFSIEYIARIFISPRPLRYIFSFWGLIDLLSIMPTYLSFFVFGYHYLLVVRVFRLLRVFRIFKLARFNAESKVLMVALKSSLYKISIFLLTVLAIVVFLGTIIYVVEGGEEGFTSIPQSIYWAVVTVTTVGYGDMVPHSVLGKFISALAMMLGYAIIAVPTGIVTVAMSNSENEKCGSCDTRNNRNAKFCNGCGKSFSKD
ncbi:voltage-gated potassium channel [Pedobacter sp. UYEF25]